MDITYGKNEFKKGIYRHYKGNYYELLDVAKHSETLEPMVIYRALYGDRSTWTRPASMWGETVNINGKTVPRFEYIEDKIGIEHSCGAIVYKKAKDGIKYLLALQTRSKTWSFPKGHMEKGESKRETAVREVFEETSLKIRLEDDFMGRISYPLKTGNLKHVYFFLAKPAINFTYLKINDPEIKRFRWVSKQEAVKLLPGCRILLDEAENYILNIGK